VRNLTDPNIFDADELDDYLELRDPKVREHILRSRADLPLAGAVQHVRC